MQTWIQSTKMNADPDPQNRIFSFCRVVVRSAAALPGTQLRFVASLGLAWRCVALRKVPLRCIALICFALNLLSCDVRFKLRR
jgi:hypothetical protein